MLTIYCNSCFETQADSKRTYYVTGCFHVFCEGCLKNTNKFCIICKKQCKVLPINDQLPTEVKNYFDPRSIGRLINTIEKISHFMDVQNKAYVSKNYHYRAVYHKYKKSFLDLKEYNTKLDNAMQREKAIINKLKQAYQSKVITPNLFQIRSPLDNAKETTVSSGYHSEHTMSQRQQLNMTPSSSKSSFNLNKMFEGVRKEVSGSASRSQFPGFDRPSQKHGTQTQNIRRR